MELSEKQVAKIFNLGYLNRISVGTSSCVETEPKMNEHGYEEQTVILSFKWVRRDNSERKFSDVLQQLEESSVRGGLLPDGTVPVKPETIEFSPDEEIYDSFHRYYPRIVRVTGTVVLTEENQRRLLDIANTSFENRTLVRRMEEDRVDAGLARLNGFQIRDAVIDERRDPFTRAQGSFEPRIEFSQPRVAAIQHQNDFTVRASEETVRELNQLIQRNIEENLRFREEVIRGAESQRRIMGEDV